MPRTLILLLLLAWPALAQAQGECQQSWTFSPTMHTLRNNVDVGGIGHASVPFYSCVNNTDVYVIGQDGVTWFKYLGGSSWTLTGADPGGTHFVGILAPPIPITECDHVWTIAGQTTPTMPGATLRDGLAVGGGTGTTFRCFDGTVWVLGTDVIWYSWSGGAWIRGTGTVPGYSAAVGEQVSLIWRQSDLTEVTGWEVDVAGQPHVDVPLSALANGEASMPFPTATAGDFAVTVSTAGCLNRDAATKVCLEFGSHATMTTTVRVTPDTSTLPTPQAPTGARVQ